MISFIYISMGNSLVKVKKKFDKFNNYKAKYYWEIEKKFGRLISIYSKLTQKEQNEALKYFITKPNTATYLIAEYAEENSTNMNNNKLCAFKCHEALANNATPIMDKYGSIINPASMYYIGNAYCEGNGVDMNWELGKQWIIKAFKSGHENAWHKIFDWRSSKLLGTDDDEYDAMTNEFIEKYHAEEKRYEETEKSSPHKISAHCEMMIANDYLHSNNGKDAKKAFEWYQKAAKYSWEAKIKIGEMHMEGISTPVDTATAMKIFMEVYSHGITSNTKNVTFGIVDSELLHATCDAAHNIGVLLLSSDPIQAAIMFKNAENLSSYDYGNNIHYLAYIHHEGIGVEQSYQKAGDYCVRAVNSKFSWTADILLAKMTLDGTYKYKDKKDAIKTLQNAIEKWPNALYPANWILASHYCHTDPEKAIEYLNAFMKYDKDETICKCINAIKNKESGVVIDQLFNDKCKKDVLLNLIKNKYF